MYDRSRVLNRLDDPFEFARISHIWKVYDKEKLVELHRQCTLEGLASKIRCPLLVVHGTQDFVPVEQAKRTYDEAQDQGMGLLEGGNHVATTCPFATARSSAIFLPSIWGSESDNFALSGLSSLCVK
jgi:pimeloyl-ACP methyl ester carboxylesterase